MKSILYVLFFLTYSITSNAQNISVESFAIANGDISASTQARYDSNGDVCGLVKVFLPLSGVLFNGNVVGKSEQRSSTYWVYMSPGSKRLQIEHPDYPQLNVVFKDFGITSIQGKTTYNLVLKTLEKNNPQTQILKIKVIPTDALVQIDGEVVDESIIRLTVGTHKYNVAAKGFFSQEGTIEVKENTPAKLNVELDRKTSTPQETSQHTQNTSQSQTQHTIIQQTTSYSMAPLTFTVYGEVFTMQPVEGGTFTMGATSQMIDPSEDEKPAHKVTLDSYYIGETEVTQGLWKAVMGKNPSHFIGDNLPVERVSWDDCIEFINSLNAITGKDFRLPTEAEWEFAARGGNKSHNTRYSGSDNIDEVAWYGANSGETHLNMDDENWNWDEVTKNNSRTHNVKTKKSNELGIYDMTGNVWEWCNDLTGKYSGNTQINPTGAKEGKHHSYRGGDYGMNPWGCQISNRGNNDPCRGLRLALSVK